MLMNFEHGLLMGIIGCLATFVGFFIVFLVINYNKKKEEEIKKQKENIVHPYGDDTVWVLKKNIQRQRIGIGMLEP